MDTTKTTKFNLLHRLGTWCAERWEAGQRSQLRNRSLRLTLAADSIPSDVRAAWARHGPEEFPGLPVTDAAWLRCSLGLAQFFEACKLQRDHGPCALPSKAADSVWHAWLQLDPAGLAGWQQRHFGRVIDHQEAQALGAPLDVCLARTWAGACASEGSSPIGPQLPLVFALDALLRLPTGWAYRYTRNGLVHRLIDGFGKASGPTVAHAAIAGSSLVALGLLSASELATLRRRQSNDGGSSCGGSWSDDAGGCDGGSDGGSGCGSGCGGGGD